ncbi:conserved protein of unknown function (plasmid) [Cupriavidus neocaledonicus]|uniref:Uncharacterized protein n=2 Tax=Cupriavidus neocaledonicus TaxID=1040979 RepID=A0A375HWA7_9BURK|nr:conserved hypothetical protein [Cupriavidus neocaledonicus]SPD60960.1 conserved protein of unknown function [Cupriavidus neocaledonicus]
MGSMMLVDTDAGTTDGEIRDFPVRYRLPACDDINRVEGDGSRPAVTLPFNKVDAGTLRGLVPRINHISWMQRKVDAMALAGRFE